MNVTKYTRAGYKGKEIICPQCNKQSTVFHFAWSALGCCNCNAMINKYEWQLVGGSNNE